MARTQILPPEVLLLIFKSVFEQLITAVPNDLCDRSGRYQIPNYRYHKGNNKGIVLDDPDLRSQSLFPYAISSVSRAWRDVTNSVPLFWTRLVFFVGEDQTPLSEVRQSLQRSRDLFISVYVLRKGQESTDYSPHHVNDHQERAYVRELMPLLNPHLHRMITLSFDLIFNSSLPRLFEDIYGDACPHLESLTLNCKYDDEFETIDPQIQMNPQDLVPLVLPSLTDLSINGRALALLLSHPGIMVVESDGLESLSVSCYTPREGESIDLLSFIKDFLYLTIPFRLRLDSIPFIWNPDEVEDAISTMDSLMDLTFHNLPQGAADVIFRLVDQQGDDDDDDYDGLLCINISECSLPAPNFLLMCEEIWLKDIEFPCDLAGFTSLWVGSTLVIENCPGYAVNAMLDSMVQMCPGFDWLNAPELTHLELINCRDFSIARLKHLWEVRENTSVPPPLDKIYVTGYGPMLSLTDRQWIERHPERLHFDIDEWND